MGWMDWIILISNIQFSAIPSLRMNLVEDEYANSFAQFCVYTFLFMPTMYGMVCCKIAEMYKHNIIFLSMSFQEKLNASNVWNEWSWVREMEANLNANMENYENIKENFQIILWKYLKQIENSNMKNSFQKYAENKKNTNDNITTQLNKEK